MPGDDVHDFGEEPAPEFLFAMNELNRLYENLACKMKIRGTIRAFGGGSQTQVRSSTPLRQYFFRRGIIELQYPALRRPGNLARL